MDGISPAIGAVPCRTVVRPIRVHSWLEKTSAPEGVGLLEFDGLPVEVDRDDEGEGDGGFGGGGRDGEKEKEDE